MAKSTYYPISVHPIDFRECCSNNTTTCPVHFPSASVTFIGRGVHLGEGSVDATGQDSSWDTPHHAAAAASPPPPPPRHHSPALRRNCIWPTPQQNTDQRRGVANAASAETMFGAGCVLGEKIRREVRPIRDDIGVGVRPIRDDVRRGCVL